MGIPVVVRCDCGAETHGNAGDELVCKRCGRRYETDGVVSDQLRQAGSAAVRHKLLTRLGIGVIGLTTIFGLLQFGWAGFAIGFLASGAIWFGLVMRRARAKSIDAILDADTVRIKAR